MILECKLMNKNRLHPWMYITIYAIGAIFPAFLFPPYPEMNIERLTWMFAIIEWTVCAVCIVHALFVGRWLARERRSKRQVDADAVYAESLYQDEEREGREGELVLIDEEAAAGEVTLEEATPGSSVTPGE
jgi:hypothetical protein